MTHRKPANAAVYGIDLGKNVFHIAGASADGTIVGNWKLRRDTLLRFFMDAAPALIGMEACPGSQWLARQLQTFGHRVRIIPAQFVKPYVKSNKSDVIDAAAIAEAVTRPTMRFVEIKSAEQAEIQALHRIRDRMVTSRTRLISQMRALCMEFGVAIHQGAGKFKADMPRVLTTEENDLTPMMRRLLADLLGDLRRLDERVAKITREIEANAAQDERSRRLMTVPGIGPLIATAILASAGDGRQFRTARDMAAWLVT